jgi:transcriptional regulator with XRE-family HTH domain
MILLRKLREDAGLTQEGLAWESGVTSAHINRMENGHINRPHLNTLRALAVALEFPEDRSRELMERVKRGRG